MTRAVHRAALAIAAAADNRFALAFLADHTNYYHRNYAYQYGADDNRPNITYNPLKHMFNSFL